MVAPIYFPVFNPNLIRYYNNLEDDNYTPTLNDWLEKYTHSDEYEQDRQWIYVRVGIAGLKFFARIGILIEIEINHLVWSYIDSKTWHRIHDACEKLVTKMQEYRYGRRDYVCNADSATSRLFERLWADRVANCGGGTTPAA